MVLLTQKNDSCKNSHLFDHLLVPPAEDTDMTRSFKRKHWKAQNQSLTIERPDYFFKVILTGDPGTGKSKLSRTFCTKVGVPYKAKLTSECRKLTEYVEKILEVSGMHVLTRLYDTAGQEKYRSLTASYYRGAHGCLVLYDVTKESSFDNLTYWLHDLKEYTSNPEISTMIVGTKCHVSEDKREVTYERAQKFAESVGVPYIEVSAEEGTNVTEVFEKLADLIIENMPRNQSSVEILKSVKLDQSPPPKKQWCTC